MYVRNLEVVSAWPDRRVERTVLAAPRNEVSLERIRYTGGADGGEFDGEFLRLCEVDSEGRLLAVIHFDPDDRRAASRELLERGPEFGRALRDRDLARIRALLPEDFSFHDHRRTGPGRLASGDYIAWLGSLFESSPDALIELERVIAREAHGTVSIGHTWGTLAGGGDFESRFVQLDLMGDGGAARAWELFELEDLDLALARLAEFRAAGSLDRPERGDPHERSLHRRDSTRATGRSSSAGSRPRSCSRTGAGTCRSAVVASSISRTCASSPTRPARGGRWWRPPATASPSTARGTPRSTRARTSRSRPWRSCRSTRRLASPRSSCSTRTPSQWREPSSRRGPTRCGSRRTRRRARSTASRRSSERAIGTRCASCARPPRWRTGARTSSCAATARR